MTPMQILRNNMENFADNISMQFKDVNLNKAEPKTKTAKIVSDEYANTFSDEISEKVFERKGVKSDFLRLFQAKTKLENYSIGFHFSYIGKNEDQFRVVCSLKSVDKKLDSQEMIVSSEMTMEEFKEKINPLNILLHAKSYSVEDTVQLVSDYVIEPNLTKKMKLK